MPLADKDVAAIKATTDSMVRHLWKRDSDAYLADCTDDVVFLPPPGQPNVTGRDEARAFLQEFPAMKSQPIYQYDEVDGNGDLAYARGTFTVTPMTGESMVLRAMLIFRRDSGGSWKVARDMWHGD